MPYQHIIFVEGPDDQHAIFHLLKRHKVLACLFDEEEDELVTRTKQSRKSNWVFQVVPFRARGGVGHQSSVLGFLRMTDDY